MPNLTNADSPITLLGIGRSGTSLLDACFRAHRNIQSIDETSGLIFSVANGAHSAQIPAAHKFADRYDFDGYAIRQLLIALEPSDRERWFRVVMGQDEVARLITPESTGAIPLPDAIADELSFKLNLDPGV